MAKKLSTTCEQEPYILEIIRGFTVDLPWTFSNPDDTPINLTGKNIVIKLNGVFSTVMALSSAGPATPLGSAVTIIVPADGTFRLLITDEETLTAVVGAEGYFWIELHEGGNITPLGGGTTLVQNIEDIVNA